MTSQAPKFSGLVLVLRINFLVPMTIGVATGEIFHKVYIYICSYVVCSTDKCQPSEKNRDIELLADSPDLLEF